MGVRFRGKLLQTSLTTGFLAVLLSLMANFSIAQKMIKRCGGSLNMGYSDRMFFPYDVELFSHLKVCGTIDKQVGENHNQSGVTGGTLHLFCRASIAQFIFIKPSH
jgi:hypothetical protein